VGDGSGDALPSGSELHGKIELEGKENLPTGPLWKGREIKKLRAAAATKVILPVPQKEENLPKRGKKQERVLVRRKRRKERGDAKKAEKRRTPVQEKKNALDVPNR